MIEGPTSYHNPFRVEGRRDAGPANFSEVQDKIQGEIRSEKRSETRVKRPYLEKLRRQTVISSVFDDPAVKRASAEAKMSGPANAPVRR